MSEPAFRHPISGRQQSILTFITEFIAKNGWAPSLREIGTAVGLDSTSSVAHQLVVLQARGYIRRHDRQPRAIAVIP